jgi:predicted O-methyltransferase YrrM
MRGAVVHMQGSPVVEGKTFGGDGADPDGAAPAAAAGARAGDARYRLAVASLQTLAQEAQRIADHASALLADPAQALSPESELFSEVALRSVPRWHFAMLNDTERNNALVTALRRVIPAGATVLDIGSGSGLLAMAAVRAGAGRVFTCEMNPLLAEVARQVVEAHGMAETVTVIGKPSHELAVGRELPAPVDVVVSEIVDCALIGEGLLPSMRHTREHLLAPGGIMLPIAARLHGRLVHSEAVMDLNQVSKAAGFDVSAMNTLATRGHFPVRLHTWPHQMLSEAATLLEFDLRDDPLEPGERTVFLPGTGDGQAHGLVVWFEMDLGGGITLSNSPANTGSHWMQGFVPFQAPVPVGAGETVALRLRWDDFRLHVSP